MILPNVVQQSFNPGSFGGTARDESTNATRFLSKFNRIGRVCHWTEQFKVESFPCHLYGAAEIWFDNLQRKFESQNQALTWAEVEKSFLETFVAEDSTEIYERKLNENKQLPDQSLLTYLMETLDICHKLDPGMSDKQKIRHINRGLVDCELKGEMMERKFETIPA